LALFFSCFQVSAFFGLFPFPVYLTVRPAQLFVPTPPFAAYAQRMLAWLVFVRTTFEFLGSLFFVRRFVCPAWSLQGRAPFSRRFDSSAPPRSFQFQEVFDCFLLIFSPPQPPGFASLNFDTFAFWPTFSYRVTFTLCRAAPEIAAPRLWAPFNLANVPYSARSQFLRDRGPPLIPLTSFQCACFLISFSPRLACFLRKTRPFESVSSMSSLFWSFAHTVFCAAQVPMLESRSSVAPSPPSPVALFLSGRSRTDTFRVA